MKNRKRILSLLVTFCTLFTLLGIPRSVVLSAEPDDAVGVLSLPDIITEAEAAENGYVARVSAAETNLNTLVFRNADGTNTMRIFDHPVKFEDGGTVKDITLGIKTSRGGFISAQSPIRTVFPSRLSDGISLAYDDIEIEMIPEAASRTGASAALSDNGRKITYAYGNRTALEYTLTYTGFKEDIVVEEYTGQTDFDFTLRTNGLILVSEDGSYYLHDAAGKTRATLGDIIIFTADERNNAFGSMTHKTVTAGQEYVITVHVDDEYLKDEKTAYPIRIDPTVEIVYDGTNASAIEDVTLNSLETSNANSGAINVGKRSSFGISRILMKFPGLDLSQVGTADQIISARVELRDLMCYSTRLPVGCYIFQNAWNINTVNWANSYPDGYDSTVMDTKTVYYGNGDSSITGGTQRYSYYITAAVKRWKNSSYAKECGIIFKTTNEIENGSTNISVCFASYNRASNKPSFTMVYSNPYLADPDDYLIFAGSSSVSLQQRANCYGFAMRFLYSSSTESDHWKGDIPRYKQQPGEFGIKSESEGFYGDTNYSKLLDNRTLVLSATGFTVSYVMNMIEKDMTQLGYKIISRFRYAQASQIPSATSDNRRLILLVVGGKTERNDYHFYVQNSDNTWSHKPGWGSATNCCVGDCGNHVALTNSNILQHCFEGGYSSDYLFFYTDKPATVDYCHGDGGASTCRNYTPLDCKDVAGNDAGRAKGIGFGTTTGRFDYNDDVDCFGFDAVKSDCSISLSTILNGSQYPYKIHVTVKKSDGSIVLETDLSGLGTFSLNLSQGNIYYLELSCPTISINFQNTYEYRFVIS